ncbi:protein phosphatase 1 regulatory inhibitor subunit PPP1R8 homolog [Rhododendron vialii]|uniref:protein phosphatase 1 regulatory inhibitor subunit PPP1R8 homolog n=1 Tax=Rhododendron vialii TaxID=182163 RepID=UPI00265D71D4|nr:protein phosphatase 1 regulatory inhibitor subunit PPP1R8 homolog [Rhododendron vialii]XP_058197974.1 protein phosphatase 1 regulatory inhibitor subunit PPP1R8 homolog [Rhododendron vialii]XP_058197976.1 protein phosphatase 1 regulatory inhibitor subunit PPP1R8 homolog [Rhododendron vialii]XP_058197977.1 protein phosphatase 1 regulatory inhibitor subunit PPP1R8 homolog [Rhododendron vialii]
MYGRAGLDRFKKAQSLEPFSVTANSTSKVATQPASKPTTQPSDLKSLSQSPHQKTQNQSQYHVTQKPLAADVGPAGVPARQVVTQLGGGQSTWKPPDWAIEPRPGVYYLDVLKDGEVLDRINLDKRRHIFGRQAQACDFVLDHQSVSRQHAAVIPHKNGSIYVIDLGSPHGTFVANERLTKDSPVELEAGQSLRFAASTRTYILRKNSAALFPPTPLPTEINHPPSPDPLDEEAVLTYNTFLNRYGLTKSKKRSSSTEPGGSPAGGRHENHHMEKSAKKIRKMRVAFRDQVGGELVEVVGVSDGVDVDTEPGPVGVKEGSLVGKYESLVQITVIPKGKEQSCAKEINISEKGVTDRLQEVLNKVKNPPKSGIYDDLYGESFSGQVGSSWAYSSVNSGGRQAPPTKDPEVKQAVGDLSGEAGNDSGIVDDDSDDLFGD